MGPLASALRVTEHKDSKWVVQQLGWELRGMAVSCHLMAIAKGMRGFGILSVI